MSSKKSKPVKWEDIYKQFYKLYPLTRDKVMHWCPRDQLTITIYLEDGSLASYNYLNHRLKYLNERWKE